MPISTANIEVPTSPETTLASTALYKKCYSFVGAVNNNNDQRVLATTTNLANNNSNNITNSSPVLPASKLFLCNIQQHLYQNHHQHGPTDISNAQQSPLSSISSHCGSSCFDKMEFMPALFPPTRVYLTTNRPIALTDLSSLKPHEPQQQTFQKNHPNYQAMHHAAYSMSSYSCRGMFFEDQRPYMNAAANAEFNANSSARLIPSSHVLP